MLLLKSTYWMVDFGRSILYILIESLGRSWFCTNYNHQLQINVMTHFCLFICIPRNDIENKIETKRYDLSAEQSLKTCPIEISAVKVGSLSCKLPSLQL